MTATTLYDCFGWRVVPNDDPETNTADDAGPAYPWIVVQPDGEVEDIYLELSEALQACRERGEAGEVERLADEISGVCLEDQPLAIVQAIAKLLDVS